MQYIKNYSEIKRFPWVFTREKLVWNSPILICKLWRIINLTEHIILSISIWPGRVLKPMQSRPVLLELIITQYPSHFVVDRPWLVFSCSLNKIKIYIRCCVSSSLNTATSRQFINSKLHLLILLLYASEPSLILLDILHELAFMLVLAFNYPLKAVNFILKGRVSSMRAFEFE